MGVFSQDEVRSRIASGELLMTDHGWAAGQGDWKLLSAFPDLVPPPKPSPLPPPPEPVRELPPRPEPVGNFRRPKKKPADEPSELGLAPATTPPASIKTEPAPVVAEKTAITPEPVKAPTPVAAPQQPVPNVVKTPVAEVTPAKPAEPEPAPKPQTIYFEPEKSAESALPEATPTPRVEVQPEPVREPEIEEEPETTQPTALRQDLEPDSENVIRVTLESKPRHAEPVEELEPAAPRQTYEPKVPGEAVASMVLGLLSISFLPILAALPAVSLGHIAKRRIESSHGLLRGAGVALTGLVTGYIGSALALVALLWAIAQAFIGFVDTRAAQETSATHGRQIAHACRVYAADHGGKFPESLEKLVPNYLPDSQTLSCPFSDPSEVIGYHYYGGTDAEVQGKVLLISKGRTTRKRHVVVYADATTALLRVPAAATSQEAAP